MNIKIQPKHLWASVPVVLIVSQLISIVILAVML